MKKELKQFAVFIRLKSGKMITRYFKKENMIYLIKDLKIKYENIESISIHDIN